MYRCTFEVQPFLIGPGLDIQDPAFFAGWDDNNGGWAI
jgi:hypothetical protein